MRAPILVLALLIMGCRSSSDAIRAAEAPPADHFALERAPAAPAETPMYRCAGRPASSCSEDELEGTFQPGPSVLKPVRSGRSAAAPVMSCELRRDQLRDVTRMYEESRVADAEYAAKHCSLTWKAEYNAVTGARREAGRAWICDGHIVDVPISVRTSALEARVAEIKVWMREHCSDNAVRHE